MNLSVAGAVAECLKRLGVKRIYGLIGTSILDFIDVLYDYRDSIRFVTTRHEQVAVSMADAEGRLTEKPGIAVVHVGGGFLNSLISVAMAYKDSSPMILISGAVRSRVAGLDSMYEVDQMNIIKPVTKAQFRVDQPQNIIDVVSKAYSIASSPPYGPVYIEVTEDIWTYTHDYDLEKCQLNIHQPPTPSDKDIEIIINYIKRSEKPLILAGKGINIFESSKMLLKLSKYLKIPIVTTGGGRGVFPETHPLSLGRIGFGGGSLYSDKAFEESDFIIALGCGLSDISTYSYNIMPKGEIVLVNLDDKTDEKPVPYSEWFYMDANIFLKKLVDKVIEYDLKREYKSWWNEVSRWKRGWDAILNDALNRKHDGFANPSKFFKRLNEKLNMQETIITAGQGMHILYTYSFLKIQSPKTYLAATNLGAMGFAFPAALAAKIANPKHEVIAVVGDGEFMMTIQDIETAFREKIPVKVVIVNDNSYRVLYYRQKLQKKGRLIGTLLTNPNFKMLAESFGVEGRTLNNNSEIDDAIDEMLKSDKPYILDLQIHPDDIPPLNLDASLKMTSL